MDAHELMLIRQAQEGDTRAFDRLVCLHDRRILQIAVSMMGNLQDAFDVYQETFIRAHTRLATFRFDSAFSTWLTRIAINAAINARRKRRWSRWLPIGDHSSLVQDEMLAIASPREDGPEQHLFNTRLQHDLERSLERLSERERAVFILKYRHEYRIREIAEITGCAEGTVKNYLFRATRKLKVLLKPYEKDVTQ